MSQLGSDELILAYIDIPKSEHGRLIGQNVCDKIILDMSFAFLGYVCNFHCDDRGL